MELALATRFPQCSAPYPLQPSYTGGNKHSGSKFTTVNSSLQDTWTTGSSSLIQQPCSLYPLPPLHWTSSMAVQSFLKMLVMSISLGSPSILAIEQSPLFSPTANGRSDIQPEQEALPSSYLVSNQGLCCYDKMYGQRPCAINKFKSLSTNCTRGGSTLQTLLRSRDPIQLFLR